MNYTVTETHAGCRELRVDRSSRNGDCGELHVDCGEGMVTVVNYMVIMVDYMVTEVIGMVTFVRAWQLW